jgi:hypothetical protein
MFACIIITIALLHGFSNCVCLKYVFVCFNENFFKYVCVNSKHVLNFFFSSIVR